MRRSKHARQTRTKSKSHTGRKAPYHSEPLILDIGDLSHDGQGIARHGNMAVFVQGGLPGDRVRARVTSRGKRLLRARVEQIIVTSEDRTEPDCPVFGECGGCSLLNMRYEAQTRWKTKHVRDVFERIANMKDVNVRPCIAAADPNHYRNKMQFPVAVQNGRVVAGCYARGTHRVVGVDDCGIQHPTNNLIARESVRLIEELGLTVYGEDRGGGFVRHIMGRVAPETGESVAVIVTSTRKFSRGGEFASALMQRVPGLAGVVQNINPEKTSVILGSQTRLIAGRDYIDDVFGNDRIGRLRFRLSPLSFYQVNSVQAAELYATALRFARLRPDETALDLYCGIGTITLFLAKSCKFAMGIEEVSEAIQDARKNAHINRIDNAKFVVGKAERVLPELASQAGFRPDVVVLDPPRAGCEPTVLRAVSRIRPSRVVYVSCYPSTLARDTAVLARDGYSVVEVQPVDMFPGTSHVECVVLITRVKE